MDESMNKKGRCIDVITTFNNTKKETNNIWLSRYYMFTVEH